MTEEQQQKLIRMFNKVNQPLLTHLDCKRLKWLCKTYLTDYRENYNIINIMQKNQDKYLNVYLIDLLNKLEQQHKLTKPQ